MDKLIHVQALMRESELSELKKKTGEEETKEALRKAVLCYMEEHNKEAKTDIVTQHREQLKEGAKEWADKLNRTLISKLQE